MKEHTEISVVHDYCDVCYEPPGSGTVVKAENRDGVIYICESCLNSMVECLRLHKENK